MVSVLEAETSLILTSFLISNPKHYPAQNKLVITKKFNLILFFSDFNRT